MNILKKLTLLSAVCLGFTAGNAYADNTSTQFMSYWFSWSVGNASYQYPNLTDIPKGVNMVAVAFALEKPDHSGLQLQYPDDYSATFKQDIATLHQRGTKVILSSGGATAGYPWDDSTLTDQQVADQFISYIQTYNFDGLDFDVEAGTGQRLPNIVKIIKAKYPNLIISLTVPSTGPAGITTQMTALGQQLYKEGALNYVDLMNYDQYWTQPGCTYSTTDMNSSCYVQNIQATTNIIEQWGVDAAKAKQMVSNGIMIGYADDAGSNSDKIVTPQLAGILTNWLKTNGYGAVMTWGLSRDQSATKAGDNLAETTGMTGIAPQTYTNTIIQNLTQ